MIKIISTFKYTLQVFITRMETHTFAQIIQYIHISFIIKLVIR